MRSTAVAALMCECTRPYTVNRDKTASRNVVNGALVLSQKRYHTKEATYLESAFCDGTTPTYLYKTHMPFPHQKHRQAKKGFFSMTYLCRYDSKWMQNTYWDRWVMWFFQCFLLCWYAASLFLVFKNENAVAGRILWEEVGQPCAVFMCAIGSAHYLQFQLTVLHHS